MACLRVSKDELTQELGLEAQRAAILAWAQRQGVSIVAWVNEEVSGGAELDERPRLLAAVAAVEAHRAGYLVFHRLDRFARNTTTAALVQSALSRVGASLVSADGVGNGDAAQGPISMRNVERGRPAWSNLRLLEAPAPANGPPNDGGPSNGKGLGIEMALCSASRACDGFHLQSRNKMGFWDALRSTAARAARCSAGRP